MDIDKCYGCLRHRRFDSRASRGRRYPRGDDVVGRDLVDPFRQDIIAILNSKALRRAGDKTQVITAPDQPHVRTRLSHTHEVVALATQLADIMGLNVELCQAIAYGHDIGHAPFGHFGEKMIAESTGQHFDHATFGVIIAQRIERRGSGLNLSAETLEGMLYHSSGSGNITMSEGLPLEYIVVKLADKIGYTFADINDTLRYQLLIDSPGLIEELQDRANRFGPTQRARLALVTTDLIQESAEARGVSFRQSPVSRDFDELRQWMFEHVYRPLVRDIHRTLIRQAYEAFKRRFNDINPALPLALLTDGELIRIAHDILVGDMRISPHVVSRFGATEVLDDLRSAGTLKAANDIINPDLDWIHS